MARSYLTVVIPSGSDITPNIPVPQGQMLAGVLTPGTFTGVSLSFRGHPNMTDASVQPIYKEGTLYSVACGVNRFIALDTTYTKSISVVSIASASTEAAARTLLVMFSS